MENVLEKRLDSFAIRDAKVYSVIELLRQKHGVPISFIESEGDPEIPHTNLDLHNVSLKQLLETLIAQNPNYRFKVVSGRPVILPKVAAYDLMVKNVAITNLTRFKASEKYAAHLRRQFVDFKKLSGPVMKGNPRAPIYSELVSLKKEATVIEHLIQLLGENEGAVLSVLRARSGVYVLVFEGVHE